MKNRLTSSLCAVTTCAVLLTGCTGSPTEATTPTQTLDEACDEATTSLEVLSKSLRGIMNTAQEKPLRASKALTDLSGTFVEQTSEVTQEKVDGVMDDIHSAIDGLASEMEKYADSDDEEPSESLLASSKNLTESLKSLNDVCSPAD